MVKVRSKHSIAGDVVITKGQIVELPEATAEYWVKNGIGEYYIEQDKYPEAEKIEAPDQNPEAEPIEKATAKMKAEKAVAKTRRRKWHTN